MPADGFFQKRAHPGNGRREIARPLGVACRGTLERIPPRTRPRYFAAVREMKKQAIARREREGVFDQSDGFADTSEQKIRGEGVGGNPAWQGAGCQQGAQFRGEHKSFGCLRVIERLNTQRVASQEKNRDGGVMFAQIQESEGKHAPQFPEEVFAPLFPTVNENLRVRLRREMMPGEEEAFSQFAVVVQLAVEDDGYVGGFVPDGLVTTGNVDDAKAAHAQGEARSARVADKVALIIGSTMAHGRSHASHARLRFFAIGSVSESTDSAHAAILSPDW